MRGEALVKDGVVSWSRWRCQRGYRGGGGEALGEGITLSAGGVGLSAELVVLLSQAFQLASKRFVFALLQPGFEVGELLVEEGTPGLDLHGLPGEGITSLSECGVIDRCRYGLLGDGWRRGLFTTDEDENQGESREQQRFHGRSETSLSPFYSEDFSTVLPWSNWADI